MLIAIEGNPYFARAVSHCEIVFMDDKIALSGQTLLGARVSVTLDAHDVLAIQKMIFTRFKIKHF